MNGAHGEASHSAKLTESDVLYIRRRYDDGSRTIVDLAVDFGVSYSTMRLVATRKSWRHLPEVARSGDNVTDFTVWWERYIQRALTAKQGRLIRARSLMLEAWEAARA